MRNSIRRALTLTLAASVLAAATPALSADGVFLIGYGARQKALGGAGAADTRDAMGMSINPAGIVGLERQFQAGMTAIVAERGYRTDGTPLVVAPGDIRSERPLFPVPNSGYVHPIDAESAFGEVSYGNGGLNTALNCCAGKKPLGGPFGGGFAGIDLEQFFYSVVYARYFGPVKIGFAPTLAAQMVNIQGLKGAGLGVYSADPGHLSDNGYDYSFGGGFRVGAEWAITPQFRIGVAASTPMFMTPFRSYGGFFPDHGRFDIPASVVAGVAYDVLPNVTVLLDWRHIFYSAAPGYANSSRLGFRNAGAYGGTGFGWTDTDSESVGVEWRNAYPGLTLRGGYHHTSSPIGSKDVTLNILSPAISRHHVTGGFAYQLTKNSSIDFATVYIFKNSLTGNEALPPPSALAYNPGATVTSFARGVEFTLSYTYKWDAGDHSWIPTHF
jgi:long-chain fatty acid transport protein